MDLTQVANLGEFIGGVAVLVTLIYLALQLRHNTSALRAGAAQAFGEGINGVNLSVCGGIEQAPVTCLPQIGPARVRRSRQGESRWRGSGTRRSRSFGNFARRRSSWPRA